MSFDFSEKAELFNSIHNYEIKLEEEQSRKWMADEEVSACLKCNTTFGWTLRKVCRLKSKIFIVFIYLFYPFVFSIIVVSVKKFSVTIVRTIGSKILRQSLCFYLQFDRRKNFVLVRLRVAFVTFATRNY